MSYPKYILVFIFTIFCGAAFSQDIAKGSPFNGQFRYGNKQIPDVTEVGKTITYRLIHPSGYSDSSYSTKWAIDSIVVKTNDGLTVNNSNYTITLPSMAGPGTIKFLPGSALLDSLVTFSVIFNELDSNNFDTVIARSVMVAPTPHPNFRYSDTLCMGETSLYMNLTSIHSGQCTYMWYFGDGDSSDFQHPYHEYKNSGFYTVRLVARSYEWNTVKDTSMAIEISAIPTLKMKITSDCEGIPISFQNQTVPGKDSVIYEWDFGDGSSKSSQISPNHLYNHSGTFAVRLTATTSKGCVTNLYRFAHQFARPVANFDAPTSPVCSNEEALFPNNTTIASGKVGAFWTYGDGISSTVTDGVHIYYKTGTFTVKLLALSEFDCADSIQKSVTIKESPAPDFIVNPLCSKSPTKFTNLTPETIPNPVYAWTFSDSAKYNTKHVTRNWPHEGPYGAKLFVQFTNGCKATASKDFKILIQPKADFNVADVCSGESAFFVNQSQGDQSGILFSWDFGDGSSSTIASPIVHYNPNITTTYTATLIAWYAGGCKDTFKKTVTISETPTCDFAIKSHGFLTYTFTPTVTNYPHYEWFFGDGENSGQISPTYQYKNSSIYTITMKASNDAGCNCFTTKKLVTNTGIQELNESDRVAIYPNPSTGNITIQSNGELIEAEVYDVSGKLMFTASSTDGIIHSDLSGMAKGMYFIKVRLEGELLSTYKFTLE